MCSTDKTSIYKSFPTSASLAKSAVCLQPDLARGTQKYILFCLCIVQIINNVSLIEHSSAQLAATSQFAS
jgi:hypothetical protein